MPKMKTNRSAAKRMRLTGKGKIKRSKAYANHFLTRKNTKRKRRLRTSTMVHAADEKRIRRLLPNH